ncbi:MAG: prepilin-type N-terminal cleavage/methylation domain-containing protein [Burkholderiales bacterium]|nr:prepilin-type N-terminal cleavage/methylation domain-containing protein [Burkholderiales bacterium]
MTQLRSRHNVQPPTKGFTLIEMLAVLTLAALLAGLTLPSMQRWFDSVSRRAQLSEVVVQFQRLSARAALMSQTIVLTKDTWKNKLADGEAALPLPEGWTMVSDKPITIFHSGVCVGGNIELVDPNRRKILLQIAQVTCDVSLAS